MNAFFEHHKDSILFGYRCFDRVLLDRRPSLDLAVLAAWTDRLGDREQFPDPQGRKKTLRPSEKTNLRRIIA